MKRQLLLLIAGWLTAVSLMAVPAKRGITKLIQLADGTTVEAELTGDEFCHFWRTADGRCYRALADGTYTELNHQQWSQARARRAQASQRRASQRHSVRKREPDGAPAFLSDFKQLEGRKQGLVILVNFADKKFQEDHTQALYHAIMNAEGYTNPQLGFKGSVHDYFMAQSQNRFDLQFDVIGPVELSHDYGYYGENNADDEDKRAGEMVAEACLSIADMVNFTDYDWDGDGEVDQVFVLYAGRGEATSSDAATIWPHEWELSSSDYGRKLKLGDVSIDTYACSNELESRHIAGIGTICHEFAHCLGYADHYDIDYNGIYGTDQWDIMCSGCYNGNEFLPCNFTAFERYCAGWTQPIVLDDADLVVDGMLSLSDDGDTYVIFNPQDTNECLFLENRQKLGWDSGLSYAGLLITHLDYDRTVWYFNCPNSDYTISSMHINDHERYGIVSCINRSNRSPRYDYYPNGGKDSLTYLASPSACFYNGQSEKTTPVGRSLTDIRQNSDAGATISFVFHAVDANAVVTAIHGTQATRDTDHVDVYSADGRLLRSSVRRAAALEGLPRGLYIVDGQKRLR